MSDLESELRDELRRAGIHWSKGFSKMPVEKKEALLAKKKAQREESEAIAEECRRRQREEPVPRDIPDHDEWYQLRTLQHGTGGGTRVIRSTRGLGG